ncbi:MULTISPECIES: two-component system response regulator [unclassified Arsukibacterium]|uniref:two-component system response regulator n=1 Tax=unclassified Arsukibacterium TaxID=2635278 RepID=UPI000C9163DD|nr:MULTISPECIES: EAL domain-containing protein [unclassified Arsukibacterium]MAA95761.1 diguanylate phosphodiesterase [Rheinheimera sp.]HAW92806.1 diguanylate phosphodiesterase [Candidatus Azambacteria bacterium]|tara:strand:+ start:177941 stop:180175 length:2235 start_codon:yes stop_codon:yes gene_type:complete
MKSNETDEDFLFFAEDELLSSQPELAVGVWNILIVDDDEEIHTVTKLALNDLIVLGRKLNFHHAYSGDEAIRFLHNNQNIAMVLLDVVMESDDAGLKVVQRIRDELHLEELRIVLRTGQPGYAPEENVIKEYDINDYKTKTELTRGKLVTTIIASIRSYQQIRTINQNRIGLQKIINAGANLLEQHSLHEFSEGVVTQIASLIGLHAEGVLCAQIEDDGSASDKIYVLGAAGHYAPFIKCQLDKLDNPRIVQQISLCLSQRQNIFGQQDTVLYLGSDTHCAAVYIETNRPIEAFDRQLIEVFLSNISIGYENVTLFQQLKHAAYIDPLTKTPNRNEFIQILQDTRRFDAEGMVAVLVDIDHFSDVNDGLGQDVGNELLIALTLRLIAFFGTSCQLGRIGADVFGLVGPSHELTPERLEEVFSEPFQASEHALQVTATFGLCHLTDSAEQGLTILKHVYIALNKAKKSISHSYQFYQPQMEDEMAERLSLLRKLRSDFSRDKLELWYQPQVSLSTKQVVGMEALLRWPVADGKYISPAVFIPLAEYSGLIVEIGSWVLEQACQQIKHLAKQGFSNLRIAVNVSMPQFRNNHFVQTVIDCVNRYDIDPALLELEITESVVMDEPKIVIDALQKLKNAGIKVAIDDFGIGFSSLSYLQQLPLDRIKVDRAFVREVTEPAGEVIAQTIINLGKRLGLSTIAEGVETIAQQQAVEAMGCDEVQGFLFAKPMPTTELLAFLADNNSNKAD